MLSTFLTSLNNMHLYMMLQIMRERRIQRGALTLASAEVKFQIDTETHDPLDIGMWLERQISCSTYQTFVDCSPNLNPEPIYLH